MFFDEFLRQKREAEQKKQAEEAAKRESDERVAETTRKMLAAAKENDRRGVQGKAVKASGPAQEFALTPDLCGKVSAEDKWNAIFAMQRNNSGETPPGR